MSSSGVVKFMSVEIDTDEMSCTPPEIQEPEKISPLNSLPEASKKTYLCVYDSFVQWKMARKTESFSESVLLVYFKELSSKYKPSTLWTTFSMLRSTISLNHGVNIENYSKLRAFLKGKSEGFRPKKASTFSAENINEFLTNALDEKYLATKVALIMGVVGGCRANEMYEMKLSHLKDLGSAFSVEVPKTKTKISRKFTITGNFYEICKKYISLRPPHVISDVFFLNFQNGKCTKQRIGINKFTRMGKQIAEYLKLPDPEKFSGISFRRSSSNTLDAFGDTMALQRYDGWKSTAEAESHFDESLENEMETAKKISISIQSPIYKNNENISTTSYLSNSKNNSSCSNSVSVINLEHCVNANITINANTNVTININN